jgi:BirA family transcriptional regulator, biotin operon repressor / biotin---[acetyl-CoA-carboxylase] ligase
MAAAAPAKLASKPEKPKPASARAKSKLIAGLTDPRIDSLLSLLCENTTIVISGAKIAREIHVSRGTVWRWVQKLRALGVEISGHPRTGYHIDRIPDILAPKLISRRLLNTQFWKHIYHFFKVDSTNEVAMLLGDRGEPHGAVVLAEEQTSGRGRAGRTWHSERSAGIYCSILLRPEISPAHASLLTLLAGLAARDAVADEVESPPDIRWPNDLLLDGKKFCGILTEMRAETDRIRYAVVGIGINVNQTKMPAQLAPIATSLRMISGRVHSRTDVLVRLLRHINRYYNLFLTHGAPPLIKRFAEVSSYYQGKHVRIRTAHRTFDGVTAGLEPSGILRVTRDNGETELVLSGDVSEI